MVLKFPDSADSADLAAAGYSQVIILGGGDLDIIDSVSYDFWEPSDISSATLVGWFDGSDISANGSANTGSETQWTNKVSGQNNLSFNGTYLTIGNDYVRTFAGSYLQETGTASLHQANDWRVFIVGRLNGRSGSDIYGPIVSGVRGTENLGAYIYWKGDDDFASYGNYNTWTNVDGQNVTYRTLHSNTALFDFKASTTNGHVTTFDGGRASYSGGDASPAVSANQLLTFGYQALNTRRVDVSYLDIVIIQGTLSSAEEEKLYGYLAHKAGIQGELPSSNAYQNTVLPPNTSTTTQSYGGDPATVWTIPEGVDSFSIMAIGAGGAAGYSDSTNAGGGGGGGGLAYLNNIAVEQGSLSVQSISVIGGKLGVGGESDGGDATDLNVTMNLGSGLVTNLSGYNINPYGQAYYDSDSDAKGIMFVGANRAYDSDLFDSYPTLNLNFDDSNSSTADQFVYVQPTGPFGAAAPVDLGGEVGQIQTFNILNSFYTNQYKILADPTNDSNIGAYTQTFSPANYTFAVVDNTSRLGIDSSTYFDSPGVFSIDPEDFPPAPVNARLDSAPVDGNGNLVLFGINQNFQSLLIGGLPGASPYVDSFGTLIISNTGDPYDYNGYGPSDLNQILLIKNLTP